MNMCVAGPHVVHDHAIAALADALSTLHLGGRDRQAILEHHFRVVELVATDRRADRKNGLARSTNGSPYDEFSFPRLLHQDSLTSSWRESSLPTGLPM